MLVDSAVLSERAPHIGRRRKQNAVSWSKLMTLKRNWGNAKATDYNRS